MEALGAAASLIAIGQAAAAIPSAIDTIRALAGAQSDLDELHNELTAIQTHLKWVETNIGPFNPGANIPLPLKVPESPSLSRARKSAENACRELRSLADSCREKRGRNDATKVRRFKWIWISKDVKKLMDKLRASREELHRALVEMHIFSNQNQNQVILEVSAILPDIHDLLERVRDQLPSSEEPHQRLVTERHRIDISSGGISRGRGIIYANDNFQKLNNDRLSRVIRVQGADDWYEPGALAQVDDKKAACFKVSLIQPHRCPPKCRCQCHVRRTDYYSPKWLKPALGSFFLQYNSLPVLPKGWKCDLAECRNSSSAIYFHYFFPGWLLKRAISISAYLGNIAGTGIYLRVPRIIPAFDDLFASIRCGDISLFQYLLKREAYSPEDHDEDGQTILLWAINTEQYDIVELLIRAWNLRKGDKYNDMGAIMYARYDLLYYTRLSERQKQILGTVAALDDTYDEGPLTGPQAVLQGMGVLKSLLEKDPSAVRYTDNSGSTALHYACVIGLVDAVKLLITRTAGALIDAQDCKGRTALMVALMYSSYDCAQILIDAGCSLKAHDNQGYNAIIYGLDKQLNAERVELLQCILRREPMLVTSRDTSDGTPLHLIAGVVYGPQELASSLLQLLLEAGTDLEAYDGRRETPLLLALRLDNDVIVRLLLEAGASPSAPNNGDYDDVSLGDWRWYRYENLLYDIRNRTLQADVDLCKAVLQAAKDEDMAQAKELIEAGTNIDGQRHKYKGCAALRTNIMLQIKGGMWETAVSELEGLIETLNQRMAAPRFRNDEIYWSDKYKYNWGNYTDWNNSEGGYEIDWGENTWSEEDEPENPWRVEEVEDEDEEVEDEDEEEQDSKAADSGEQG